MESPTKPRVPLDLVPLREASGSAILSFGTTTVSGELVQSFTVAADSPLLSVEADGDTEPTQSLVVRHGDWLAVSAALSGKLDGGKAPDEEAIEAFLRAEVAASDSARTWPKRIGHSLLKRLKSS